MTDRSDLDRTDGWLPSALQRQATVTSEEAESILVGHDRLDGRLDASESMPWLLDVVFTLAGRVRPDQKYLPWELRQHPLPHWSAIRTTFERAERLCAGFDSWGKNRSC